MEETYPMLLNESHHLIKPLNRSDNAFNYEVNYYTYSETKNFFDCHYKGFWSSYIKILDNGTNYLIWYDVPTFLSSNNCSFEK